MAISNGNYKARVVGEAVLGKSEKKGTPYIEFLCEITEGPNKGGKCRYTGYFTENTSERTVESLVTCGWRGDDLAEFADKALHGLDANEIEIVVEIEEYEYEKNGETKKGASPRVRWINELGGAGGRVNVKNAMNDVEASAFAQGMKGLVVALRARKETAEKSDPTSFEHGANAPAEQPKKAAGGKKF